jgi:hypothetical protein
MKQFILNLNVIVTTKIVGYINITLQIIHYIIRTI